MTTQDELLAAAESRKEGRQILANCTCPSVDCALKGDCQLCIVWHRDYARKCLPHCLRTLAEVTWQTRKCQGRGLESPNIRISSRRTE